MRRGLLVALAAALTALALPALATADHTQESVFQDDQYLLYSTPKTVDATLGVLRSLGVDRIRVTIEWEMIAPDPESSTAPRFDATDPAAYPSGAWTRYDTLVLLAARHRIGLEFNVTAPGPLWAMRAAAPTPEAATHWIPNAGAFQQFVQAVGRRYAGGYAGLPRVSFWSLWNEPNQPGWLAPQALPSAGSEVPTSPTLYRGIVQAGVMGLYLSGHTLATDTILIGELAPEGYDQLGTLSAMTPLRFLRSLYCVDNASRRLTGAAARAVGCPSGASARSFVRSNPGLFYATGFAHHPYYFFWPPRHPAVDPDFVPLANLRRLERFLDRTFSAYGVHRRIPIYLTEYGYQTNPPDPYEIVTPAEQARYLNQADFVAWTDSRVRSVAQFLLRDSLPNSSYPRSAPQFWDTFQTGLEYADGTRKPAYAAYRTPIWIAAVRGRRAIVWGQLRPARRGSRQMAVIQWARKDGRYRTIARIRTRNLRAYFTVSVNLPASGDLRIAWKGLKSRAVWVTVR